MSGLKNRTRFANALDTDIYNRLVEYSKISFIPMSRILDAALEEYLKKNEKK